MHDKREITSLNNGFQYVVDLFLMVYVIAFEKHILERKRQVYEVSRCMLLKIGCAWEEYSLARKKKEVLLSQSCHQPDGRTKTHYLEDDKT